MIDIKGLSPLEAYEVGRKVGRGEGHNHPSSDTLKMFGEINKKLGDLPCKEQSQRVNFMEKEFEEHKKLKEIAMAELNIKIDKVSDKVDNMDKKVENLKTDMAWLKKFFWIVATSSIGGLIVALFNLLEKVK